MAVFVSPTSSHQFALREGETLLEGLERHGYALEYQCRKGYCGTCRVRIAEGRVAYRGEPRAYLPRGEVLACCAIAQSNVVLEHEWLEEGCVQNG